MHKKIYLLLIVLFSVQHNVIEAADQQTMLGQITPTPTHFATKPTENDWEEVLWGGSKPCTKKPIPSTADVQELLTANGDVNTICDKNRSPLTIAASRGFSDIVQLLVNNKANIDHQDIDGDSALTHSCLHKKTEVVDFLIANKANVQLKMGNARTALDQSILWTQDDQSLPIIQSLLAAKAQPAMTAGKIDPLLNRLTAREEVQIHLDKTDDDKQKSRYATYLQKDQMQITKVCKLFLDNGYTLDQFPESLATDKELVEYAKEEHK